MPRRAPSSVKPGRPSSAPVKVPHVDDLPCPAAAGGTHNLVLHSEDGRPVSRCRHCNETWARLDALARLKGTTRS